MKNSRRNIQALAVKAGKPPYPPAFSKYALKNGIGLPVRKSRGETK